MKLVWKAAWHVFGEAFLSFFGSNSEWRNRQEFLEGENHDWIAELSFEHLSKFFNKLTTGRCCRSSVERLCKANWMCSSLFYKCECDELICAHTYAFDFWWERQNILILGCASFILYYNIIRMWMWLFRWWWENDIQRSSHMWMNSSLNLSLFFWLLTLQLVFHSERNAQEIAESEDRFRPFDAKHTRVRSKNNKKSTSRMREVLKLRRGRKKQKKKTRRWKRMVDRRWSDKKMRNWCLHRRCGRTVIFHRFHSSSLFRSLNQHVLVACVCSESD